MAVDEPILAVTVRLPPALHMGVTAASEAAIESALAAVLRSLDLPGRADVDLLPGPRIEFEAGGRVCGCPDELLVRARAYVRGSAALHDGAYYLGNLDPVARDELLKLICGGVLSEHPGVLMPGSATPPADAIDLLVHPAYLREFSCREGIAGLFSFMRDGLFVELGLPVPPVRLIPDESLRPRGFAVRIAHKRTIPWVGLPVNTLLVNDTPERLALMGFAERCEAAMNPGTWQPAALVPSADQETLESDGLTTWDHVGYLILILAHEVRRNARMLLAPQVLATILDRLNRAFPVLAEGLLERPDLAPRPALEALLEDEISIRDMYQIARSLLEHESLREEEPDLDAVSAVRRGLADVIGAKFSRGTSTLVVYIIDPELERQVADAADDPNWPYTELADSLGAILAAEAAHLPPTAQRPVVLTRDDIRVRLRDALRVRRPRTAVVGYSDLPENLNIQPVARLSAE